MNGTFLDHRTSPAIRKIVMHGGDLEVIALFSVRRFLGEKDPAKIANRRDSRFYVRGTPSTLYNSTVLSVYRTRSLAA